jgi:hypothetical protein
MDVPAMENREETPPSNCPLCGRSMSIVNDLKDFSIQFCHTHGIYGVDKATKDTWVLEGFDINMAPIKRKWYTIENHKPLKLDQYRNMVKLANLKRLENK